MKTMQFSTNERKKKQKNSTIPIDYYLYVYHCLICKSKIFNSPFVLFGHLEHNMPIQFFLFFFFSALSNVYQLDNYIIIIVSLILLINNNKFGPNHTNTHKMHHTLNTAPARAYTVNCRH